MCRVSKSLDNFGKGTYICRVSKATKINCPYCTSVLRIRGTGAHIKKQHLNVDLPRGSLA